MGNRKKNFENYSVISDGDINDAAKFCVKQIVTVLPEFTDKFQDSHSENNFYRPIDNNDWTNGFWTGEIWLVYEYVKDNPNVTAELGLGQYENVLQKLLKAAQIQVESFLYRIEHKINVEHHDMGFLYSLSCVAAYKLTGSDKARRAALLAAEQLITRFRENGEFIQAWGEKDVAGSHRLIIDCLLNLPLLYWASEETGLEKYRQVAERHIHTAAANVVREDYSTWHTFFFDLETGEPDHGETFQGYRDDSTWARGQAWGVYGLAIAYRYTKNEEYLELFRKVTGYFLEHLPSDLCPYWDFEFTDGDEQPRDSSSASIAVCGMLEIAKYVQEEEAEYYKTIAHKIMKSLYDNYAVKDVSKSNGLVLHATYCNKSPYNKCVLRGVDECNIWGDYYYLEALTRMRKDWNQYW